MANHDPLTKWSRSWVALVCFTVKLHLGRLMYNTNGAFYFMCVAAGACKQWAAPQGHEDHSQHKPPLQGARGSRAVWLDPHCLPLKAPSGSWLTQLESMDGFCTVEWDNWIPADPRSLILFRNNADSTTSCMKNREKSTPLPGQNPARHPMNLPLRPCSNIFYYNTLS